MSDAGRKLINTIGKRVKRIPSGKKLWNSLTELYVRIITDERKAFGGRLNPDKVFYMIRPIPNPTVGLMSMHNFVLHKIAYARAHNWIPVVDYKNFPSIYQNQNENVWTIFFEQPMGYDLEEAYKSRHVVLGERGGVQGYGGVVDNPCQIKEDNELLNQFMKLNSKTKNYIDEKQREVFGRHRKILGVLGRGTDYSSTKPYGHSIVPSCKEYLDKVTELEKEWGGYDAVFLATEDERIYSEFVSYFGERLLCNQKVFFKHDTGGRVLADVYEEVKPDMHKQGLDYLTAIYLLAECESIIAPLVAGSLAAIRINGNQYRHQYIFDLGLYGVE